MIMKRKILSLFLLCSCLCGCLCGCASGKEEVESQLVTALNITIPYSNTFDSAENVAIQYSNYIRNGYYDYAYDLMYIPDNVYFSRESLTELEESISAVPKDYILYDIAVSRDYAELMYGKKIGEAFSNETEGSPSAYLGEVITDTMTAVVPLSTEGSQPFMVGVDTAYLSDKEIAFRLPNFCTVSIGGKLLDDRGRDDEGWYKISNFVESPTMTLHISSAVEDKDITLSLAESAENVDYSLLYSNVIYENMPGYDYRWETSRLTNNDAMEWVKGGVQAVFDSIMNKEEFYTGSYLSVMSKNANLEKLKPHYTRISKNFLATKTRDYKDLTVISVTPWGDETLKKKGYAFEVLDRTTMRIWVDITYSYVVVPTDGLETVKTGTISGSIDLSKDDGEWKLLEFSDKMLKGM